MEDNQQSSKFEDFLNKYGTTLVIVGYGLFCYNVGFKRGNQTALNAVDRFVHKVTEALEIKTF